MRHNGQLQAGGRARSWLAECSAGVQAGPQLLWSSGLCCSFLACLIFSFSALFVKLTGNRLPVLEVCLLRSSMSFGLSWLMMRALHVAPLFGQRRNRKLLFIRGCCGALAMTTYYIALFLLPLGDAVTINLIGPPVTAAVARVFLGEPLGYRGAAGCLVSMAGVLVLAHPPFLFGGRGHADWGPERALGTLAGVVSALLGAGSSMTIRMIGPSEPASVIALWFHTGTMLLSIVPLCIGWPDKAVLPSPSDGALMVGVAVTSFAAQLLGTRGLQLVVAAKAAAMGFTQVLYSYLMGAIFFRERLSSTGVLGVLLILAGVLLVTMRGLTAGGGSARTGSTAASSAAEAVKGESGKPAASAVQLLATAAAGSCCMRPAAADDASEKMPMLASWAAELPGSPELHGADAAVVVCSSSRRVSGAGLAATQHQADGGSGPDGQAQPVVSAFQQRGLLDEVAVTAHVAAALGGEQCPAVTAFHSLAASRQASVVRRVSRSCAASRQASALIVPADSGVASLAAAAAEQVPPGLEAPTHACDSSLKGSLGCDAAADANQDGGGVAAEAPTASLAGWLPAVRHNPPGGGSASLQDSPLLVAVPAVQEGVQLWQLSEVLAGHWAGQQQQALDGDAAELTGAPAGGGGGGQDGGAAGDAAPPQPQASVRTGSQLARGGSSAALDST